MRAVLPSPLTIGRSLPSKWAKLGSISSFSLGIPTQNCSPCSGSPSLRRSGAVRSECTMPRPAVIQFTAPGWIAAFTPVLSR